LIGDAGKIEELGLAMEKREATWMWRQSSSFGTLLEGGAAVRVS
jgi:hypothetical protein